MQAIESSKSSRLAACGFRYIFLRLLAVDFKVEEGAAIKNVLKRLLSYFHVYVYRSPKVDLELLREIRRNVIIQSKGILHIGAHRGQEAGEYSKLNCKVIWVEAIPEIFEDLSVNIAGYTNQRGILALLGDQNRNKHKIYLSSNDYKSSSVYNFGKDMKNANLKMIRSLELPMYRLDSLIKQKELVQYTHWVIDVQGAELSVLIGAGKLLENVNSLEIEISTREEYEGGTNWENLVAYLGKFNLYPLWNPDVNSHEDIIFIRTTL